MRAVLLLIIPLVFVGATLPSTSPSTEPSRSVWDGVYSDAQVARGKKAYNSLCARCHGEALLGNDDAPQLVDADFLDKWNGKSVGSLVVYTQKKMPTDGPGKLSRKQCTDVTAYVLNANGFPSGQSDLAPDLDVLNGILIQEKK